MIIGITGSFGSGKTTTANIFKKYGFKVINVDRLYHGIYNKNKSLKNRIKKEFGTTDRNKLKKIVFSDSRKLKKLNKITHPLIIKEVKKAVSKINKKNIIIDSPLLLEAKAKGLVDKIIVVKASKKNCIERILTKKKYSKKEIEQIMKSQMPLNKKLRYADFVVDNNKSVKDTRKQVKDIVDKLNFLFCGLFL